LVTRIAKGNYALADRNLTLELGDDIELGGKQVYYLCGGNGLGKTSFLERVLIPALEKEGARFLYLGQDLGLQLYTLKASLAVEGLGLSHLDDANLIRLWLAAGRGAQALLLDEFDKYYPDYRFVFQESADSVQTYVLVSHADQCARQAPEEGFARYQLNFTLQEGAGPTKRVRVDVSPL
jgi:hypothetical protein